MKEKTLKRKNISSGAPWEEIVGYSRAVRSGDFVFVTGTIGLGPDGAVVAKGDMYAQARRSLEIISEALNQAGASFKDVVRTRMFVTDITKWREAAKAHGEVFAEIKPATTLVEVNKLIDPEALIEIEVDAMITAG
jgi:enamine deaminase RidA (YjgF/YER057c/UK114 family)